MTRLAVAVSLTCIIAGLYLVTSQTAAEDSFLEVIAHGIGIYLIGKGLFVGPSLWQRAKPGKGRALLEAMYRNPSREES